ncbi:MAG: hypothetical protein ARM1_0589 [Candidatus Micrarchaeota archaeon]|nr:MAG: hypothetical protein ARM1_0589 [Candidatus Micrarchaeota archaeon]
MRRSSKARSINNKNKAYSIKARVSNKNKRQQAALDFLITYGWALIIIAAILVILLYLHVFNSTSFVSNSCIAQSSFQCNEALLNTSGRALVRITSNEQYPINITAIACSNSQNNLVFQNVTPQVTLAPGQSVDLEVNCYYNNKLYAQPTGSLYSGYVVIKYYDLNNGFPNSAAISLTLHTAAVSITTTSSTTSIPTTSISTSATTSLSTSISTTSIQTTTSTTSTTSSLSTSTSSTSTTSPTTSTSSLSTSTTSPSSTTSIASTSTTISTASTTSTSTSTVSTTSTSTSSTTSTSTTTIPEPVLSFGSNPFPYGSTETFGLISAGNFLVPGFNQIIFNEYYNPPPPAHIYLIENMSTTMLGNGNSTSVFHVGNAENFFINLTARNNLPYTTPMFVYNGVGVSALTFSILESKDLL